MSCKINERYYRIKVKLLIIITLAFLRLGDKNGILNGWRWLIKRLFGLVDLRVLSVKGYISQYSGSYQVLRRHRKGISPEIVFSIDSVPFVHQVNLPDLYLSLCTDIWIRGRSDCLFDFSNRLLLNDFGYYMDEELYTIQSSAVYSIRHHVALVRIGSEKDNYVLESGVMLGADYSENYYHFLHEVLSRLLVVLSDCSIPLDIPLLVDKCINQISQLKEAFNLINNTGRTIIWLEENSYYFVKELYYIPQVHLIPPQVLKSSKMVYEDIGFDSEYLTAIRNLFILASRKQAFFGRNVMPKKVFISREGHPNRSYNEEELFEIAKDFGFVKISPEKYSFLEQVQLFQQAEIIVGATGAAFSNLLFCKEGSISICFVANAVKMSIFSIDASISSNHLIYLVGVPTGSNRTSYEMHSDYYIPNAQFRSLLQHVCSAR